MGFHICQQKKSNRKILSPYRRSQTGRDSFRGFHICQQKKSNRKILSQWLPYMLAEEVKPEDTLPGASIYVSRRSQTGRYSPMGFHICQQKKSNRKILSQGLPYMLAEEVKPEDTLPGASIYVSRRSQTGRYSPSGFHICQQKKSNRKILSQGLPYMLAEEVKPEDTLPGASIYVSRRSQTGRFSPRGFHICQQKKSNRKILSQGLPYMLAEEVKPEDNSPRASIYVSRRSQTGRYSPRGFHICQQKKSNRKILSQGLPYMLAEEVKPEDTLFQLAEEVFHICQQKKSNRKILSQGLPYMLAEEVKPEDTLPGTSIYVSRRSQTGRYSPRGFHICQQKKSNRKQGLPYMLGEVVKPEDTLPGSSIYVSRSSQTGIYSPMGFHICQQKKSNRNILSHGLPFILAEEVKPDDTRPGTSIYVSRRSQTGRYSPSGFHICQQKKSNRKIISQWLPYMLAEEVKPEDTLPSASIYVSRRSQTGRYSPRGFHICQQKKSNRKILSQWLPYVSRRNRTGRYSPRGFHICQQKQSNRKILSKGLPYMLAEEVKPEVYLPGASIYVSRSSQPEDTLPGSSIYVSRSSQTGIYSPMGFHICQQKKSNRNILSHGLPYILAEEVKPDDTRPGVSIYVSRRSQTGRYSPRGFHICQQKKSNRKILSQGFHICQQKKSKDTLPGASIYVSRRSQTGRYSPRASIYVSRRVKPEDTLPGASIYVSRRSQTGRYSPRGFHICQQKKSNRKILSHGLPYMLAEEVKPEDTLPGASIYVSRRSQTGRYSPRGFHICQQKKSNRKILSQGLPYMLAEEVKPEDTRPGASIYVSRRSQTGRYFPGASIYVSRRSQTGRYSPRGFHICQQKQSNRKILSQGLLKPLPGASIYVSRRSQTGRYSPSGFHICQQKKSNRKILSQGLPYMLAEEVKPEDNLPWASIYVSRRSQTGRYSPKGFHICQQKKSNRKILFQGFPYRRSQTGRYSSSIYVSRRSQTGRYSPIYVSRLTLPYMLAEEVKPEDTLPGASIYVSRRSQTGRYSPRGFHICQQKKSNRKILSQGLPYMLAEEVKPEDTLPGASIYVSRRSQTGRYSPRGFHICQQKKSNRKIIPTGFHICQQKKSNRKILSQGLPYMLAEEVKPEDTLPGASIYVSRRSQTGRYSPRASIYVSRRSQTGIYSPMGFHICQQKKSNRKILSQGLPYMLAEEVKPEDTLPGLQTGRYSPRLVSRRSQTGRYSPRASIYVRRSQKILSQVRRSPEDTLPGASIYVSRRSLSQGLPYMLAKPEDTLPAASIYVSRRSQTGRYSPRGFHICQQKKSNRKILSQGLPYMLAEEVKPEDTLPGASIYVSRRSQTGRYSPSGFHICQQKKSNRKILSQGLPYMLAEEVKPEDTLPWASIYVSRRSQTGRFSHSIYVSRRSQTGRYSPRASIYVSRRSQTGRYSPRGFHICQQKKSNRKILSQGLPYMLAEEVKPEDTLPWASIYVSRRSQTGRYSPRGFHICQQKKSNRKILSQRLPYMLAEEVKPEDNLPVASIYVSRRSQTGRYSPKCFHICQQKRSNRKILSQGLPYMLAEEVKPEDTLPGASIYVAEEVKPEDTLPGASIYVSRRSQTGRYSPMGFHICQQKKSNRKILSHGLPFILAGSQTG